jgi:hypothetical protein
MADKMHEDSSEAGGFVCMQKMSESQRESGTKIA